MITLRNGKWYCDFYVNNGKTRVRKSTGFLERDRTQALAKADELRSYYTDPIILKLETIPTFKYAALRALEQHYKYLPSYKKTVPILNSIIDHIGHDTKLIDVNENTIEDYIQHLRGTGVTGSTINRYLNIISKVFDLAVNTWRFHHKKVIIRRQRVEAPPKRIMDDHEEMMMLYYFSSIEPQEDMFRLCVLLIDTGMRLGEALGLAPKQIGHKHKTVYLWETKTNKERTVPLSPRSYECVTHDWKGFKYNTRYYQQKFSEFKSWLDPINPDAFTLKCLRHTCATRMLSTGTPLPTVSKWLGHSDISTTMIYLQIFDQDLLDVRDKLWRNK